MPRDIRSVGAPKPVSAPRPAGTAELFRIPKQGEWAQNIKGKKSDPVNLYLHGSLDDVRSAFLKAGWLEPVPKSTKSMLEYGAASAAEIAARGVDKVTGGVVGAFDAVTGRHAKAPKAPRPFKDTVDRMPIAHLYFNGKPDVLSFEKGNNPTGGRHHFRVFDTGKVDANGQKVWAVCASLDVKTVVALDRPEQMFINHIIDPNADLERDTVLLDLEKSGAIGGLSEHTLKFGKPAPTGLHSADGRVFDVTLKTK